VTDQSDFRIEPLGRFSLAAATGFAGGFSAGLGARASATGLLATFPVEGWTDSAAVDVWQADDGSIHGEIHGATDVATVRRQVARSLSLDHDGSAWEAVGQRDPLLGAVQARFDWLRPVCFYSAYEAATSFVIGQRISMRQGRIVKDRLAATLGDEIEIDGSVVRPFPRPERLLEATDVPGLSAVKVSRLHDLARAALDGRLDTERLRALPETAALAELRPSLASGRGRRRRS
jgi:DNA-3-methyladenine glycosylase II